MNRNQHWETLLVYAFFVGIGLYMVLTGSEWSALGRFPVPAEAGWGFFLVGLICCALSIRALLRGDREGPRHSDAEVKKAEAALDALYEREHGTAPDKTGGPGASGKKDKEAGPEPPEPATERAGRNADPGGFLPRAVSALTARTALLLLLALAVAVLILFRQ